MQHKLSGTVVLFAAIALSGCGEEKKAVVTPPPVVAPVVVAKPINLETISNRLSEPAFGAVDGINGAAGPVSGSVIPIPATDEKIRIGGFAVDSIKGDVAAGVLVLIDDKPHLATYGGERPDIAATLKNPKYLKSQFYMEIPAASLAKGLHDVKFRVVSSDKTGYYESAWSAKIEVK